ncbi:MAG: hypothetical protein J6J01_00440, partial [Oscillospiraceae bacterium]|nr:hypothetical protein [Oscillospiraceae bacterium]
HGQGGCLLQPDEVSGCIRIAFITFFIIVFKFVISFHLAFRTLTCISGSESFSYTSVSKPVCQNKFP